MSILINGMDMPKNGRVTIELASEETGTNIIARITDDKTGKLIEYKGVVVIPTPHGDLIDRSKIHYCHYDLPNYNGSFYAAEDDWINEMAPIIEAEE